MGRGVRSEGRAHGFTLGPELLQTQSPAARAYRGVKRPPHSCTIPQTPGLGLVVTGRCEGLDRHTQELEAAQMSQS